MGRHAEGWKLEWRRGIGYVRFTHRKRQHLISTRTRDPREAAGEAGRIYARVVAGAAPRPVSAIKLRIAKLDELLAKWIASLEGSLDPETVATYETTYAGVHWLFFGELSDMLSPVERENYREARLRQVSASTVKKETWALDKFLRWCREQGVVDEVPPPLVWSSRTLGTRSGPQRAVPVELTPAQVELLLAALPLWREVGPRALEHKPYAIRRRLVVMYETGLRPATLDALRWGMVQDAELVIPAELDKSRFGRRVPLSARAAGELAAHREEALARGLEVGPENPVFGGHDVAGILARTAQGLGLGRVAPYDLRHARGTHLADAGASLTGIGYLLGHRQATTTNRYLHGTRAAAQAALSRSVSGARVPPPSRIQGDRRGSNPRQLEPQSGCGAAEQDYIGSAGSDRDSTVSMGWEPIQGASLESCAECDGSGTVLVIDRDGDVCGTSCSSCLTRGAA